MTNASSRRLRVLLVEDTAGFSNIFAEWLTACDVEVDVAATGLEAANRLCVIPYDLAFIDYHLPDFDAPGVVRMAKAQGGSMPDFYVITGDGRDEIRQACLSAGCLGVLVKPILYSRFAELIEVEKLRRHLFG